MIDLLWILPTMIALMSVKALFSGAEIAFVHADKVHLQHRAALGDQGAARVLKLIEKPEVLLATTLIGTNVSIVAITTLGALFAIRWFGDSNEIYAVLALTPILLIFTEIVPKSVFQQKADVLAPKLSRTMEACSVLFFPAVWVFSGIAAIAARLFGVQPASSGFMSREKMRALLNAADKTSDIDTQTWKRLRKAVRLADVTVGDVMIPMAEMTVVARNQPVRAAVDKARSSGHFRLPVRDPASNEILGIVAFEVSDLLSPNVLEAALPDLMQPAHIAVPQQAVLDLLPVLRERDDHMAIVVDEFGSAIGMVTMEDIQEDVLGEFVGVGFHVPGYVHRETHTMSEIAVDEFLVDARLPVSEVNDELGIALSIQQAHTIGGWLTAQLRHLPVKGESVTDQSYRFVVEEADGRIVRKVRIEPSGL